MSTDGQGTKRHRNIAENFHRLSRVHERYRRQTDRRRAVLTCLGALGPPGLWGPAPIRPIPMHGRPRAWARGGICPPLETM